MSSGVYYYVTNYNDEMPPHEPTLECAAFFLQTGRYSPDVPADPENETEWEAPLAAPGDIIELDTLTVYSDAVATFYVDDAARGWRFDPPIPDDADFGAIRHGEGMGWSVDSVFNPTGNGAADMMSEWADGETDAVEYVVFGRTGNARARFDLIDGKPLLTLLVNGEAVHG